MLTREEVEQRIAEHRAWCEQRRQEERERLIEIMKQCPHDWPGSDKTYICHYCGGLGRRVKPHA